MKKILALAFSMFLICSMSFAVEGTNKTINLNRIVTDEIEERGEIDYFSFRLSKPGSVQIEFDFDVEFEYVVKLINEDTNNVIQNNRFNSKVTTHSGRIEKHANKLRLGKGNYQIQVSSYDVSREEYELKVIYDEETSNRYEKENNNEAKIAMILDYDSKVIGNLDSNYDVDYYMVEIPSNGEVFTEFRFDKDAKYKIEMYYDKNGDLKSLTDKKYEAKLNQSYDKYFDVSEVVRVPAGNYYFKITSYWSEFSNEDYEFVVRYKENSYGNYEIEYNNEAKNATPISANFDYIGNLNSYYDKDYYNLRLYNANKMKIKMNVPDNASYIVTLYKEVNGELSRIGYETFTNKELVKVVTGKEYEITDGNYYFCVSSRNYSNRDYKFNVEVNDIYNYNKTVIVLKINSPYMEVNGGLYSIDMDQNVRPIILNGRTLLPIRPIIEKLGGKIKWINDSRGIDITLGNNNVYLTLDKSLAYVNGYAKYLDVVPTSINGRTMMPVKFIMENLGGDVVWNDKDNSITITY